MNRKSAEENKNELKLEENNKTFNRLKELQGLLKKESALKTLCKK